MFLFFIYTAEGAAGFPNLSSLKSTGTSEDKVTVSANVFEQLLNRTLSDEEVSDIQSAVSQAENILEQPQEVSLSDFSLTVIPLACLYGRANLKSIKKLNIKAGVDVQACIDLKNMNSYLLSGVGLSTDSGGLASAGAGVAAAVYVGVSSKIQKHVEGKYYFYKFTKSLNPLASGFAMAAGNDSGQFIGFVGAGVEVSIGGKKLDPELPGDHSAGVMTAMTITSSNWLKEIGKNWDELTKQNEPQDQEPTTSEEE